MLGRRNRVTPKVCLIVDVDINFIIDLSLGIQGEVRSNEWNVILEQRVSERTESLGRRTEELAIAVKQLERSNQELDDFAYIASHDLKEPLLLLCAEIYLVQRLLI